MRLKGVDVCSTEGRSRALLVKWADVDGDPLALKVGVVIFLLYEVVLLILRRLQIGRHLVTVTVVI